MLDHIGVVAVFGPEVGIADGHAAEGEYSATAVLVHGLYPGVVVLDGGDGGGYFVDIEKQAVVADSIATEHVDVVYSAVVANDGIGEHGIIKSFRQVQVTVMDIALRHGTERYTAHEYVVADKVDVKSVVHLHQRPVFGAVAEELKLLDFLAGQRSESFCFHNNKRLQMIYDMN